MTGSNERSLSERAAEAFARAVATAAPIDPQDVDPETLARLQAAMRRLSRRDREMFLAHRLDGMPYDEIARRTGLSVKQVERAMVRALKAIGDQLHDTPARRRWWPF